MAGASRQIMVDLLALEGIEITVRLEISSATNLEHVPLNGLECPCGGGLGAVARHVGFNPDAASGAFPSKNLDRAFGEAELRTDPLEGLRLRLALRHFPRRLQGRACPHQVKALECFFAKDGVIDVLRGPQDAARALLRRLGAQRG
jgi:hypothetical protein